MFTRLLIASSIVLALAVSACGGKGSEGKSQSDVKKADPAPPDPAKSGDDANKAPSSKPPETTKAPDNALAAEGKPCGGPKNIKCATGLVCEIEAEGSDDSSDPTSDPTPKNVTPDDDLGTCVKDPC